MEEWPKSATSNGLARVCRCKYRAKALPIVVGNLKFDPIQRRDICLIRQVNASTAFGTLRKLHLSLLRTTACPLTSCAH